MILLLPTAVFSTEQEHFIQYVGLCAGLSVVAAFHFWQKARGQHGLKSCLVYAMPKCLLALGVFVSVGALVYLQTTGAPDVVLTSTGEEMSLGTDTMDWRIPLVSELILGLPLWLVLLNRSWRREPSGRQQVTP